MPVIQWFLSRYTQFRCDLWQHMLCYENIWILKCCLAAISTFHLAFLVKISCSLTLNQFHQVKTILLYFLCVKWSSIYIVLYFYILTYLLFNYLYNLLCQCKITIMINIQYCSGFSQNKHHSVTQIRSFSKICKLLSVYRWRFLLSFFQIQIYHQKVFIPHRKKFKSNCSNICNNIWFQNSLTCSLWIFHYFNLISTDAWNSRMHL